MLRSNALLVSARESRSGHPLAVFGPQTGYFAPQILMEQEFHAPNMDARGASLDSGFQVIVAAEMAQQGATAADIVAKLSSVRKNTWTFFTTENLKYLAASGRVPRLRATVGDLLNVRPIIHFEHDGTIEPAGQIRGRKRSLDELINRAYHIVGDRPVRAAIVHANCADEANRFAIEVRGRLHVVDLTTNEIGPVLAALAGPNTIGLAVYAF